MSTLLPIRAPFCCSCAFASSHRSCWSKVGDDGDAIESGDVGGEEIAYAASFWVTNERLFVRLCASRVSSLCSRFTCGARPIGVFFMPNCCGSSWLTLRMAVSLRHAALGVRAISMNSLSIYGETSVCVGRVCLLLLLVAGLSLALRV